MSDLPYSEESFMLKQAVCKLMEVSLDLGNNRGKALNGEFKKMDDLLTLISRVKNNMERKNEHIRV
jgi:hypothetical protein|tara:strand:+ start:2418 stop:2615 length:198 start_codon:yes stop_codon:yes gene_type:complete